MGHLVLNTNGPIVFYGDKKQIPACSGEKEVKGIKGWPGSWAYATRQGEERTKGRGVASWVDVPFLPSRSKSCLREGSQVHSPGTPVQTA